MAPSYESQYFKLTPEKAAETEYDIVIVGAGFGGGMLAADLFDANKRLSGDSKKKILLIERGSLIFNSHCLNTARPTATGDSGQQNDAFFQAFRSQYATEDSPEWRGGPLYSLGGRSNVWGLFIPRPHRDTLSAYFPASVVAELTQTYFEKAETMLKLSFPETRAVHQRLIDELNMIDTPSQWQWGKIASEFKETRNFDFAEGAYSTVDRLLEMAMNDPEGTGEFKILLNAEVERLNFNNKNIESVRLRDGTTFRTKAVALCAGSVHSPAILLRSQVPLKGDVLGGGKLTDHDMYLVERTFRYNDPERRNDVGPMKLQTHVKLGTAPVTDFTIANISVDASSFLPRRRPDVDPEDPKFLMVFILATKLVETNDIRLDDTPLKNPIIKVARVNDPDIDKKKADMNKMVEEAVKAVTDILGVQFLPAPREPDTSFALPLGNVAHELGSLPMPSPNSNLKSVVNEQLELQDGYKGVWVCDLSVFPYSPAANPSLTLAALALRLSELLSPR